MLQKNEGEGDWEWRETIARPLTGPIFYEGEAWSLFDMEVEHVKKYSGSAY